MAGKWILGLRSGERIVRLSMSLKSSKEWIDSDILNVYAASVAISQPKN